MWNVGFKVIPLNFTSWYLWPCVSLSGTCDSFLTNGVQQRWYIGLWLPMHDYIRLKYPFAEISFPTAGSEEANWHEFYSCKKINSIRTLGDLRSRSFSGQDVDENPELANPWLQPCDSLSRRPRHSMPRVLTNRNCVIINVYVLKLPSL